eukprot:jgi/Phyca11/75280/gw1.12.753.1
MAERKRWDKQHEFHPTASPSTEAKVDPVLTKQLQYIKVLEERNRVKKRLAAVSKRNDRLQEREEAFVTAFNVPTRTIPRSAPSSTLNFRTGNDDKTSKSRGRAKWNRPQAPMNVAVEHEDGVPLFRLTTQEEKSEDEEESYLEESFEEFEEEDEKKELVVEEEKGEAVDLSKTTKELGVVPATSPLKNLLEDQIRWEDEYANEMKEQLAKERQEKQRILKETEERRAKMLKQLEDEEREIERLMDIKRQERLAKLRSLQDKPTELTSTSPERCEIKLKLLSTWSRTRAVGLTQICVYDLNGEELTVDLESVQLYDQPTGRALPKTNDMVRGLPRLFNGIAETNREKDMWLGRLGDSGVLVLQFEVSWTPFKLCVWNYNGQSACTRDVEVLVAGRSVWTGSLPETFGDEDDNTCTWIDLRGNGRKTARTAR